ncbi:MAG TPA: rhodanese-like domain-containing protein [Ignavibacteriaceae bacterium]
MKQIIKIFLFIILITLNGCIKDENSPVINYELDKTAKILHYFESQGDFANSELAPGLISAIQLFNYQSEYIILDIRSANEFINGHIQNSINIPIDKLYETVDSLYSINRSKKIVIVSKNGQSSAYFVCLFRLAGFENTFSLKYGMAYWNINFAEDWLQYLKDEEDINNTNQNYPMLPLSPLPQINFPSSLQTDKELAVFRIKQIIKQGFISGVNYENQYDFLLNPNYLKICYGQERLYIMPPLQEGRGHAVGTIWYRDIPTFDFRSIKNLQTLPADSKIIIYSADGHLSACMAAYLTVLGYNVKTLLFGANQLFYTRMRSDPQLSEDTFKPEVINNYPYVTGN